MPVPEEADQIVRRARAFRPTPDACRHEAGAAFWRGGPCRAHLWLCGSCGLDAVRRVRALRCNAGVGVRRRDSCRRLRRRLRRTIARPRNADSETHEEDRQPGDDGRAPGPALRGLGLLRRRLDIWRRLGLGSNASEKLVPLPAGSIFEVLSRGLCFIGWSDKDQLRAERLLTVRRRRHRARLSPRTADSGLAR